MDIERVIDLSCYEIISNYIDLINIGDSFYMYIYKPNEESLNLIYTILDNNDLKIHNEGYNGKGIYSINTYKI